MPGPDRASPHAKAGHPKLKPQFGPCKADFVFYPTSATGGKRHYLLSEALLGWCSAVKVSEKNHVDQVQPSPPDLPPRHARPLLSLPLDLKGQTVTLTAQWGSDEYTLATYTFQK